MSTPLETKQQRDWGNHPVVVLFAFLLLPLAVAATLLTGIVFAMLAQMRGAWIAFSERARARKETAWLLSMAGIDEARSGSYNEDVSSRPLRKHRKVRMAADSSTDRA